MSAHALRHPSRPKAPWLLAPGVLLAHLGLTALLLDDRFGLGDLPKRIDVAFVRKLQPAPPPQAPPVIRRLAAAPGLPASASRPRRLADVARLPREAAVLAALAPLPDLPPGLPPSLHEPPRVVTELPAAVVEPAPTPASAAIAALQPQATPAAASAPPAEVFEWPPSTRLSYTLTGNFRGPVEGQARVEWLLSGAHYQVHLEVSIGPPFAPLITRRLSSDGLVGADGLEPRRFDELTTMAFRAPRHHVVTMGDARVRLANGRELPRPRGLQDSASQFVQMTWLFTLQPQLLQPGQAIELPLALPRSLERWTYDVVGPQWLYTPLGELAVMHVRPRREPRPGGDLTAEFWVAPSLQNLPVRFVIRQDDETWVDLLLERAPQQALRR